MDESIDKGVAVPVGRAARHENQLLIPMSDGSIRFVILKPVVHPVAERIPSPRAQVCVWRDESAVCLDRSC